MHATLAQDIPPTTSWESAFSQGNTMKDKCHVEKCKCKPCFFFIRKFRVSPTHLVW